MMTRPRLALLRLCCLAAPWLQGCCAPVLPYEERFSDDRLRARFERSFDSLEELRQMAAADGVVTVRNGALGRRGRGTCASRLRGDDFPWICQGPAGEASAPDLVTVARYLELPPERAERYRRLLRQTGGRSASLDSSGDWVVVMTGRHSSWGKDLVWPASAPTPLVSSTRERADSLEVYVPLRDGWYLRRTGTMGR